MRITGNPGLRGIADLGWAIVHFINAVGGGRGALQPAEDFGKPPRRISAGSFAILTSLYPLIAALAGLLVLGQRLTAVDLAGMVLVALAVAGATSAGKGAAPRPGKG